MKVVFSLTLLAPSGRSRLLEVGSKVGVYEHVFVELIEFYNVSAFLLTF